MSTILECKQLTKTYRDRNVLDEISLSLESGKIIGLLGVNGCGKSTFMKMCAGLLSPSKGELLIDGQPVSAATKSIVSYLPDKPFLKQSYSVKRAMKLFTEYFTDFDEEKALSLFESLDIDVKAPLRTMSKGTIQKVHLVLVMSRNAKLYLLDEPLDGIDPAARDHIIGTILSGYNPDATVVISTHIISEVEKILDEFIILKDRKVALSGIVDDTRMKYGKSLNDIFKEVAENV